MSELPKPEKPESSVLEKLESLREKVAQIDKLLKGEDLSDDDKAELLDEREGLRLQALADVMTRKKLTSFPDINGECVVYLRPSKREELYSRLESVDDADIEQLQAVRRVIVDDQIAQQMSKRFSQAGGRGNTNWVDQATGIEPVIDTTE